MQPLHVGFTSDKGGNTIDVHWYNTKAVLHHVSQFNSSIKIILFSEESMFDPYPQVWDDNIIETEEERFFDSNVDELINTLQTNITVYTQSLSIITFTIPF